MIVKDPSFIFHLGVHSSKTNNGFCNSLFSKRTNGCSEQKQKRCLSSIANVTLSNSNRDDDDVERPR